MWMPPQTQVMPSPLKMCYDALMTSIQHEIVNKLELPTHQNGGECSSLKVQYQALKNKTNSPVKGFEWVKDGLYIYSGSYI